MMKKNLKQTLLTALIPLAASAVLMGCSTQSAGAAASKTPGTAPAAAAAPSVEETAAFAKAAGSVLLSVNPEIEIEYDGRGLVTGLEGKNAAQSSANWSVKFTNPDTSIRPWADTKRTLW